MTRWLIIILFTLGLGLPAKADAPAIKTVITAQIEAFQSDDFETAFGFASPMIKRMFGTPERFGQMVRNGYPMVWRPKDMRFGGLTELEGRKIQTVFFTDAQGRIYEGAYEMIETGDGWQINGVVIREADLGA